METLRGWDRGEHTAYERGMPCTHPTYRKGDGPGVIVIHEMPGLTRGVVPVSYTHLTLPTSDLV